MVYLRGMAEQIIVDTDGAVMLITLNRPDRMNAWTWQMAAETSEAFAEADRDDSVRAIVVTGQGRAFCAGADLGGGEETFTGKSSALGRVDWAKRAREATPPHKLATPIVAAINGAAVGAGLTMPIEWDLRVVAEDAKLGFVFNRRGVLPDADLLWLIPRMIGYSRAIDVLLTGRMFSGAEAVQLGLCHKAVPRDEVLDAAIEIARDIATNTAPTTVALTKQLLYEFLTNPDRADALASQREAFAWTGRQPDAREGVMAFLEKRDPEWEGSKTSDRPEPK